MKRVRILRAFWYGGKSWEVGQVVTLPEGIARQAVAARKAEFVADEVPSPPEEIPAAQKEASPIFGAELEGSKKKKIT